MEDPGNDCSVNTENAEKFEENAESSSEELTKENDDTSSKNECGSADSFGMRTGVGIHGVMESESPDVASSAIDHNAEENVLVNESSNEEEDKEILQGNLENRGATDSDESDAENFEIGRRKTKNSKVRIESDSDEDEGHGEHEDRGDEADEREASSSKVETKSNRISSLIDSESEEDESKRPAPPSADHPFEDCDSNEEKPEKSKKSKSLSKRAAKSEALHKIHSETQRLIRESSVSLPYHRPKQRTLAEFLNRKKIAASLPKASTMAIKVKISAEIVSQALEEKEKEAEAFYVELSDEESDSATSQPVEDKETQIFSEVEKISIEETQKLQKIDVQHRQNLNGSLDCGVSRKLFLDETPAPIPASSNTPETPNEDEVKKLHKEFKRDLKDVSIPRKLFDGNFEECLGPKTTASPQDPPIPKNPSPSPPKLSESPEKSKEAEIADPENYFVISETPMISHKELSRCHQRLVSETRANDLDEETLMEDDPEEEEVDGHVIGLPPLELSSEASKKDSSASKASNLHPPNPKKSLPNIKNVKPKLRGNPGMMIDLTESSRPNKSAINNLMDRFLMKHASFTKSDEKNPEVTVLTTELTADGFKISKDTLPYKSKSEPIDENELNKPGAKLVKLKEELKMKMATKRNEEWKQREKQMLIDEEEEVEDEVEEIGEKGSLTDEESEEGSEPEEDDVVLKDKKVKNHDFADYEAEVSEEEVLPLDEDEDEVGNEEGNEDEEEDDGDDEEEEEDEDKVDKSKKFTRILRIDEDSNSGDENIPSEASKEPFQRKDTDVDIFLDEDEVDASLPKASQMNAPQINSIDSNPKAVGHSNDLKSFNDDELLELCSGKFPDSENGGTDTQKPDLGGLINSSASQGVTDSQLMNLCSGSFPTQNLPESIDDTKIDENNDNWNLKIVSSDEENEDQNIETQKKKKKVKKLVLSDDENEESDDFEEEVESEEEKFIDYDSEENEVIVVPKKDIKKVAANFLEEEAELSESDWGSEDEDEKDLDKYEVEEADAEEIDENKMRDQIGRIHARQLLDEDNRDVRMLKELLFDDGDLHDDGGGRERKFRWKNIDKVGLENLPGSSINEDDDGNDEEHYDPVGELEWRKLRLEKQKFLEEKKKADDEICSDLADGEILKLGMRILKKNNTNTPEQAESNGLARRKSIVPRSVSELVECSSKKFGGMNSVIKRGSFLARGDQALAKLAVMIKQSDTIAVAPKNAGNFVFTHLSPSVDGMKRTVEGDEETIDETNFIENTRKRKSTNAMTPKTTKKAKIHVKNSVDM